MRKTRLILAFNTKKDDLPTLRKPPLGVFLRWQRRQKEDTLGAKSRGCYLYKLYELYKSKILATSEQASNRIATEKSEMTEERPLEDEVKEAEGHE
jgi:hypothetical protein